MALLEGKKTPTLDQMVESVRRFETGLHEKEVA